MKVLSTCLCICLLVFLGGCFEGDRNFIGPYSFNPSRLPDLPEEVLACVEISEFDHGDLALIEASQLYDSASQFVEILTSTGPLDGSLFPSLEDKIAIDFTLFIPTNIAWRQFLVQHSGKELDTPTLTAVLRSHIMDEAFTYEAIVTGQPSAPDMNGRLVQFEQEMSGCISINQVASPVMVDGLCKNGVIHLIDEVFLPDGF